MNFELGEDRQMLVQTVEQFLKKDSPTPRMRRLREDPIGYSPVMWKQMGELGWLALPFSEEVGGLGGTVLDAALLAEHLAATLVPEPLIPSVVLGGGALARLGTEVQRDRWLAPVLGGDHTLALAHAERDARFSPFTHRTTATPSGTGYLLRGEKIFVLNGHAADALIVAVRTAGDVSDRDGISLCVVEASAAGVQRQSIRTMDGHRAAHIRFNDVRIGPEHILGTLHEEGDTLEEILDHGAMVACAEGVGIMRTVLEKTVEYLRTREQFGVKIGSFQVLQHRAVDMFIQMELARSASIIAGIRSVESDALERKRAISTAKVQVSMSGKFVTQQAIQLFGGIGVTDEHDVGLYFKRMHVLNTLFGDEEYHLQRFSALPGFEGPIGEGSSPQN